MFAAWAGPRISVAAQNPTAVDVKVTGCVARSTEAGLALTPAAEANTDPLVLTRAAIVPPSNERGAVPGATTSGQNSGTIGTASAPAPPAKSELSYELSSVQTSLRAQVGKRVEVTGRVISSAEASSGAHTSSPRGRLEVRSFRAIGGGCPLG